MCGRYLRRSDKQRIAEAFHLASSDTEDMALPPWDYNIAPTTHQPVIRQSRHTGQRELVLMRWGLVPFFATSLAEIKGLSTINARADTLLSRPLWRVPFERRRCLVPADGFYEWKKLDTPSPNVKASPARQPFAFTLRSHAPFAFAGLWDAWKDPEGLWLQSFTIITTDANALMLPVHKRMPVILHPRDYDRWLERPDPRNGALDLDSVRPPSDLLSLLRPFEDTLMSASACNPQVGNVRNNFPELLDFPDPLNSA